jgi:methylmalonyl-CoA mutase N-terminal domain/subunit
MWANMMKSLGATDEKAMMLRFHTQTGGSTLTAQQPINNISRVTIQTLAAVMGGTQSLHTNGFDEALSLPTEEAARTALRTQQIVAFESGVADAADPLAGSYLVESMTDEMEESATKIIELIDAMGGSVEAIEQGYIQDEIAKSAYLYQKNIENESKIIVGVNKFQTTTDEKIPGFKIDSSIQTMQTERLKQLRENRNANAAQSALNALTEAAKGTSNLMPFVLDCIEHRCTLGEISDALRSVFGEYK